MTRVPFRSTTPLLWVALGSFLLIVLAWLAVAYTGVLPAKVAPRPSIPIVVKQLCGALKKECVGSGKPSDVRLLELCQRGAKLCTYTAPTPRPRTTPTPTPKALPVPSFPSFGVSPGPAPVAPPAPNCGSRGSCFPGGLGCSFGTTCSGYPAYQCYPPGCAFIL